MGELPTQVPTIAHETMAERRGANALDRMHDKVLHHGACAAAPGEEPAARPL